MRMGRLPTSRTRRDERREEELEHQREGWENPYVSRVKPALRKEPPGKVEVMLPPDEVITTRGEDFIPNPKAALRASIRIFHQVDIIMPRLKEFQDNLDVRSSKILDIDKKYFLYLAQPTPPISKAYLNQELDFTFLTLFRSDGRKRWLRFGYTTKLLKIIDDYELGKGIRENVLVIKGPKELKPWSLRAAYRLIPPEELDFRLWLLPDKEPLGLIDISTRGAKFYHKPGLDLPPKKIIKLALRSGDFAMLLNAQVVRHETIKDRLGREKPTTCVEFYNLDAKTQNQLNQLITETYRYLLAQRSGVTPDPPR